MSTWKQKRELEELRRRDPKAYESVIKARSSALGTYMRVTVLVLCTVSTMLSCLSLRSSREMKPYNSLLFSFR